MAGFTVPNEASAAFAPQARLFQTDLEILALAHGDSGVISGCAVTAQGSPDMTVAVAAGVVKSLATRLTVTGGNATITTADGTNPRLDVVVVTSGNALAVRAGTPAASPLLPALTAGDVPLARVYIPASDTTIASNQIVDARVLLADLTASQVGTALGYTPVGPRDLDALGATGTKTGVANGLAVSVSSGLTLSVAAGVCWAGGKRGLSAAAQTVTLETADATNPRIDAVFCDGWGNIGYLKGTPAAIPLPPTMPAPGSVVVGDTGTVTGGTSSVGEVFDSSKSWVLTKWRAWRFRFTNGNALGTYRQITQNGATWVIIAPSNTLAFVNTNTFAIELSDPCLLAHIYVAANDTSLASGDITDRRVFVQDDGVYNVLSYYAMGDEIQNDLDCFRMACLAAGMAGGGTVYVPVSGNWVDQNTAVGVTSATATTLTRTSAGWTVDQWIGYWVRITTGRTRGQAHRIISNTTDTLTIAGPAGFTPIPSTTSNFIISRPARYKMNPMVPTGADGITIEHPNVRVVGEPGAVLDFSALRSSYSGFKISGQREVAKTTVSTTTESNTATSSTTTSITRTGAGWTVNQWQGMKITLTSGAALGQSRQIKSNTATVLTVDRAFSASPGTPAYTISGLPRACGYLKVVSAAGFAEDDYVAIRSSAEQFSDERTTYIKGEFQRLRSVSATDNVLTIAGGTYDSYDNVGFTVNVDKYHFIEGVSLENLTMLGSSAQETGTATSVGALSITDTGKAWTTDQWAQSGISYLSSTATVYSGVVSHTGTVLTLSAGSPAPDAATPYTLYWAQNAARVFHARGFLMQGCRVLNTRRNGVQVFSSLGPIILKNDFRGVDDGSLGYCVQINGCDGPIANLNTCIKARKGIDVSADGSAAGGLTPISRNVVIHDNVVYDMRGSGLGTHDGTEIVSIVGNKISNCVGGISCRSRFTSIIGNHVYGITQQEGAVGTTMGIAIGETDGNVGSGGQGLRIIGNYLDVTPDPTLFWTTEGIRCNIDVDDSLIQGNRIVGCTGYGIELEGDRCTDTQILDNFIDGSLQASNTLDGIIIAPTTPANGANQQNLTIQGNQIVNVAGACLRIAGNSTAGSPSDGIKIRDNTFDNHGTQALILTAFFKQVEVAGNSFIAANGVSGAAGTEAINITGATLIDALRFSNNLIGRSTDAVTGIASAGAAATLTSQAITSVTTDQYAGYTIRTITGTGPGQVRTIVSHTSGTTPVFTVNANWSVNPASGTTYAIYKGTPVYNPIPFTFGPWTVINQGASATTEALLPQMATATTVALYATTQNDIRMDRSGRVIGAIIQSNAAIASGTVTVRVRKTPTNGAVVNHVFAADACQLTSAITPNDSAFDQLGVPFAAGEKIGVALVSASLSPTTAELQAWLIIQVDAF